MSTTLAPRASRKGIAGRPTGVPKAYLSKRTLNLPRLAPMPVQREVAGPLAIEHYAGATRPDGKHRGPSCRRSKGLFKQHTYIKRHARCQRPLKLGYLTSHDRALRWSARGSRKSVPKACIGEKPIKALRPLPMPVKTALLDGQDAGQHEALAKASRTVQQAFKGPI